MTTGSQGRCGAERLASQPRGTMRAASKGRLGIDGAFQFGLDHRQLGLSQVELSLDLAALDRVERVS